MMQKTWQMTETLAHGYSSERTQWELSNKYQHDSLSIGRDKNANFQAFIYKYMAPKLESLYIKYQILGFNVLVKIGLQ